MLRPSGEVAVRERGARALDAGEACWCPIIRLELWNGAGGGLGPATDILIAACTGHHQVELEHADSDFSRLEKL